MPWPSTERFANPGTGAEQSPSENAGERGFEEPFPSTASGAVRSLSYRSVPSLLYGPDLQRFSGLLHSQALPNWIAATCGPAGNLPDESHQGAFGPEIHLRPCIAALLHRSLSHALSPGGPHAARLVRMLLSAVDGRRRQFRNKNLWCYLYDFILDLDKAAWLIISAWLRNGVEIAVRT
jgi:hypothetical protein